MERLVANATRGPSGGFSQGFAFVVLTDPDQRRMFWETTSGPEWRGESESEQLTRAPVVILPLAHKRAYLDRYGLPDKAHTPLSREEFWPAPYWDIDTGMAVMLILLTAVDLGLGALFFAVFRGDLRRLSGGGVPHGVPGSARGLPADRRHRRRPSQRRRTLRAGAPVGPATAGRCRQVGEVVTSSARRVAARSLFSIPGDIRVTMSSSAPACCLKPSR